ncbi:mutator family transposase [Acinetobacter baumannii]|nr:mutator family transposase [Acinetobacter baumannii]
MRNGYSSKTLLTDDGDFELNTPRDREGSFEPQLITKNQTRITLMDSQILSLYAKGMPPVKSSLHSRKCTIRMFLRP